jgi:transposase
MKKNSKKVPKTLYFSAVLCYTNCMNTTYTESHLTSCTKKELITLLLTLQQQNQYQKKELTDLNQKMDLLLEQVRIGKQQRFGRSSEKIDIEQLEWCFNEAEVTIANKYVVEPELEQVCPKPYKRKKKTGKREEDLKDFPVKVIRHEIAEEELKETFGDKWKRLPDEVYKKLEFHPATFEVHEHHIAVYAGSDNQTMNKEKRPAEVLKNSIVTPSLEAAVLNYKYVNAMPLYRLEQEFLRQEVTISRQVMANWTIQCAERYFSLLYDRMHREFYRHHVAQADETPVLVSKDGRNAGAQSYMWVYRTCVMSNAPPIVLYDYQRTRNQSHPKEFLKDYTGTIVTDGYEVYHRLEKERQDITIAGCWSHVRRRFADVVKSLGKKESKGTLASDVLLQIAAIYKAEGLLKDLSPEERTRRRDFVIKPMVESFFEWVKKHQNDVLPKSETGKGITYCLNQEKYLKVFLEDGNVPMDNNGCERTIRGFCIGKNNWRMIDTIEGAKASAIIYSIVETAKENNLKPYEYFKYLLEEIPKHMEEKELTFLEPLLPWSPELPEKCKKRLKEN